MDILSAEQILEGLTTTFVGRNLVYLPETGSTNDEARRLAERGAPDGALVITEHQTAGRGRLGRRWEAPPRSCLLLSIVFRPNLAPHQAQRLTMICGLAATEAIEAVMGLRAGLKWPNDVVIQEGKIGGILTEVDLSGDQLVYAVVGVGLNVNLDPAQLAEGLLVPAASLSQAMGGPVARLPLLWSFLQAVERRYLALEAGHSPHAEWADRLVTVGRAVTVSGADTTVEGVAEGVDGDGALLVRLPDGQLMTVLAGDVTLSSQSSVASA
jgi:BirA family biotin operon repressor/biotin-[acetyl-CoA-carboxylase] ligase